MVYSTQYVINLYTGEPFCFDVADREIERLEERKQAVTAGKAPLYRSVEEAVTSFELSLFPAYKELLKIFIKTGYTEKLITQILTDFGLQPPFIQKLLEDHQYVHTIRPWFEGITCDGGRAIQTLRIVHKTTKEYFSLKEPPPQLF